MVGSETCPNGAGFWVGAVLRYLSMKWRDLVPFSAMLGGRVPSNATLGDPGGWAGVLGFDDIGDSFADAPPTSTDAAMRISTVYACCRIISGSIMQMTPKVLRESSDGVKTIPGDAIIQLLLSVDTGSSIPPASLFEYLVCSMLLNGSGYALIVRDRSGTPLSLTAMPPGRVRAKRGADGFAVYEVTGLGSSGRSLSTILLDGMDVLHVHGPFFDGVHSPSVLSTGARSAVASSRFADGSAFDVFRKGLMSRHAITFDKDIEIGDRDRVRLRREWVETYGGVKNQARPVVMPPGASLAQLRISAVDAQLIETRRYNSMDIMRAYGVPNFLANHEQRTTSWGTGLAQIGDSFLRYTLGPHILRLEQELTRKLCSGDDFVKLNTNAIVRGSAKERADQYQTQLSGASWMTVNEVRKMEGLPPIPGEEYDLPPKGGTPPAQKPEAPPSEETDE